MALQMAIKQEEITNIISNPEEHFQEELQGAITALVGSTSGAEVNFYEGDELTDDQRTTVDGEDKSALSGFYDAEGNTIYLNADKTNSISDLLTVTRHENQHAIDDQDGVDYTTYSQDKDHYEDLAKKSESEFMHSLEREFGDNPNKESTSAFTDMDAGSNGAGGVEQVMPASLKTYIKRDDINLESTTVFDERPENPNAVPFGIRTRNKVTKSSKPGATDNFETEDVSVLYFEGKSYGPKGAYIETNDPRGRDIHGGGNSRYIKDPFADYQGWISTKGCTRGQNADVIKLGRRIENFKIKFPGVKIPYRRKDAKDADIIYLL